MSPDAGRGSDMEIEITAEELGHNQVGAGAVTGT